ncbi:MAG: methyltransferase domain-containing protein [Candidatus Marinimicrobia bacterium]|jgi:SAM-dependent methyltransferase|nr:methyltransferase domain-containing protein [Candidatus Neomarinimicrobiota bacterium]
MIEVNHSQFWEDIYLENDTGWDLKGVTPFFDSISNELIQGKVCILGCGRGYDAIMFAKKGFDVTAVDFAPTPISELNKLAIQKSVTINTIKDDIFSLVERFPDTFDYVIEQTCFCAIHPNRRKEYEILVRTILKLGGKLVGLWFPLDKSQEEGGPPFGTTIDEVKSIFNSGWKIEKENFPSQSVEPRKGREKLIIFKKNINQ